jgi:hypothetical protein
MFGGWHLGDAAASLKRGTKKKRPLKRSRSDNIWGSGEMLSIHYSKSLKMIVLLTQLSFLSIKWRAAITRVIRRKKHESISYKEKTSQIPFFQVYNKRTIIHEEFTSNLFCWVTNPWRNHINKKHRNGDNKKVGRNFGSNRLTEVCILQNYAPIYLMTSKNRTWGWSLQFLKPSSKCSQVSSVCMQNFTSTNP